MSVEAITWAYKQKINQPGAKFVLVTLANYADGDGFCYPGQGRLALLTGIKERTVRAHLAHLENDLRLIKREHRRGDSGKWTSDGYLLNSQKVNGRPNRRRPNLPPILKKIRMIRQYNHINSRSSRSQKIF